MTKVMLVEDDNNLREIYEARLLAEGFEIISAKDGEEALALAVKEKPELIVADIMMPKISGFDMLDILRSTPETKNTKVIMMTALSQAEDKNRAERLGADRYLIKSQVTLEDVARVVKEVVNGVENGSTTEPAKQETADSKPTADTAANVQAVSEPEKPATPPESAPAVSTESTAPSTEASNTSASPDSEAVEEENDNTPPVAIITPEAASTEANLPANPSESDNQAPKAAEATSPPSQPGEKPEAPAETNFHPILSPDTTAPEPEPKIVPSPDSQASAGARKVIEPLPQTTKPDINQLADEEAAKEVVQTEPGAGPDPQVSHNSDEKTESSNGTSGPGSVIHPTGGSDPTSIAL